MRSQRQVEPMGDVQETIGGHELQLSSNKAQERLRTYALSNDLSCADGSFEINE